MKRQSGNSIAKLAACAVLGVLAPTAAQAQLVITTTSVTLDASNSYSQPVFVSSQQPSLAFSAQPTTTTGGQWLQAIAPSPATPTFVEIKAVGVNVLPAGTYQGSVRFSSPGFPDVTVSVTLVVGGGGTSPINVNPGTLNFSFQPGGQIPSNQSFTITSTPNAFFTVTQNPALGSWLFVGPTSGALSAQGTAAISVGVNTTGLAVGTYNGTLQIQVAGIPQAATVSVSLVVSTSPSFNLIPSSATFNYQTGTAAPAPRLINISTASGQTTTFTASATVTSPAGGTWLSVSPASGTAPGYIVVSVNPANLAAGNYSGTVTVTLAGGTQATLPVSFNVSGSPVLTLSQPSSTFAYQTGGSAPVSQSQTLSVGSSGTALTFLVTAQTSSGLNWLSVSTSTGTTPTQLTVTANATGLAAGTYTGTVTFQSQSGLVSTYPVTLVVSTLPLLVASSSNVAFSYQTGAAQPTAQNVTVSSTGVTQTTLSVTASTISGGSWLQVAPPLGGTPLQLSVNVFPTGLTEGTYLGVITVTAAAGTTGNSPLVIPVVLTVSSTANLVLQPTQLTFTQAQGGPAPASQALRVTSTGAILNFIARVSVTTPAGGNWLISNFQGGITPGELTISVSAAALPQGTYTGSIIIEAAPAGNTPQVAIVTLNVTAPVGLTATPNQLTFSAQTIGQAPPAQTVAIGSSTGAIPFTAQPATTSGVPWLLVNPTSGTAPSNITVSVNPTGLGPGSYTGTITISSTSVSTPIVVNVTMTVTQATQGSIASVVNAASFQPGAIAPGEMIAIFGTNLGPAQIVNARLTPQGLLADNLDGVRVFVGSIAAPLLFARSDVVAAIVPYGIAGRISAAIQVEYNNVRTAAVEVGVRDTAPGIFTTNAQGNGQAAILNFPTFTVNGPNNPIDRGGVAILYATGEGQTAPPGSDGVIASASNLRTPRATVQVRIGGLGGRIVDPFYAGSVPTVVLGQVQVNFTIPADAPTGSAVPVDIIVGGILSQGGTTMAIR